MEKDEVPAALEEERNLHGTEVAQNYQSGYIQIKNIPTSFTRAEYFTFAALIFQFVVYITFFLSYAKWYDEEYDDPPLCVNSTVSVDPCDGVLVNDPYNRNGDRLHSIFLDKDLDIKALTLLLGMVCSISLCLYCIINIRRTYPTVRVQRTKEVRQYFVTSLLVITGIVTRFSEKDEATFIAFVSIADVVANFLFAVFEVAKLNHLKSLQGNNNNIHSDNINSSYISSTTGVGSMKQSLLRKPDDKMPDSLGIPFDPLSIKLLLVSHQVYMANWAIFQVVAFVGYFQDGQKPTLLNLLLIPLILLQVRFRTFTFAKILESYNLRWMSTETIWVSNAFLFCVNMAVVYFYYSYYTGFSFENSFQFNVLALDTAALLGVGILSCLHSYFGITILLRVARNSNYRGPDVRYNLLTILLRYEYTTHHSMAFFTMIYIAYRIAVSANGYATATYEFVGAHVVVSRIVMIIEVATSVIFCTLFSFMPPLARSNHEYDQIIRFTVIVLISQLFFASESLVAFLAFMSDDDKTTGKVSLFVGFGLIPVFVYRFDSFMKLTYKILNARRINLFTGQYHKSELYVGTRYIDEGDTVGSSS